MSADDGRPSGSRSDRTPRQQALRDRWEQAIRGDPDVTGSQLAVLLVMATYGNRDGSGIHVGVDRLADDVVVSPATVRRAVQLGRRLGYLERVARGHRINDDVSKPSEYALRLKPTAHPCVIGQEPTAHLGRVGSEPTAQTEAPNSSNGPSQLLTTDRLPVVTTEKHHSAREDIAMAHTDKPDPLDAAAAIWSDTHPGQEREALNAAIEHELRRGVNVTHPAGYFATWPPERRAAIKIPTPALPPCPDCHHSNGWLEDPETGKPVGKCTHPRRGAVA